VETAVFNGDELTMDTGRLTLVFNKTHGESQYPDRFMIGPELSLSHFDSGDWEPSDVVEALFRAIIHDFGGRVTRDALAKCQPCFRQLAGMLDLTVQAMLAGKKFGWKYPENGLHPQYQGNIADVAIALTDPAKLKSLLARQLHFHSGKEADHEHNG
jgi:hypothetical protein